MDRFSCSQSGGGYAEKEIAVVKRRMKNKFTLLMFLLALLSMITVSLAWFTISSLLAVDRLEMTIGTGAQLLVSMEDHGTDLSLYTDEITNDMIREYLSGTDVDLGNFILDPVTSTDSRTMYNQGGVVRPPNTGGYLEYEVYFIATEEMWVHLSSDSSDDDSDNGTAVTTSSTGVQAAVVSAVRTGFEAENQDPVIYEPDRGTAVGGQTTFDLPTPMQYTDSTRLFRLEAMTPTRVAIRFWLEGEDPQCNNDVQSANIAVQLCFKGTDNNNVVL